MSAGKSEDRLHRSDDAQRAWCLGDRTVSKETDAPAADRKVELRGRLSLTA